MERITDQMRDVVLNASMFSVATASSESEPNVVPIKFIRWFSEDEFLMMDNFMEKTEANLKENPQVAISCWHMNAEKKEMHAYQFKGDARFIYEGEIFDEGCEWVQAVKPGVTPKAAVIVKVTDVYNLQPGAK